MSVGDSQRIGRDMNLRSTEVDERSGSWETSDVRFRIYLHTSDDGATHGATETHDLTGCDVVQAIDWAQHRATPDRTYAIALVMRDASRADGDQDGLVWLLGMDGNDVARGAADRDRQRRMLTRRSHPIVVPLADTWALGDRPTDAKPEQLD